MSESQEKKIPYELQRYIEQRQRREIDGNQADHRTTSQSALDAIQDTAEEQFNRGLAWIATLSAEEKSRAARYFRWRQEHAPRDANLRWLSSAELSLYRRDGVGWLLVPHYLTDLDMANELVKVLCPEVVEAKELLKELVSAKWGVQDCATLPEGTQLDDGNDPRLHAAYNKSLLYFQSQTK